jgi:hypothetical protein
MTFREMLSDIPSLTVEERKRLIAALVDSLAGASQGQADKRHDILDFEGVGAHLYDGSDAQDEISAMRAEWDTRP